MTENQAVSLLAKLFHQHERGMITDYEMIETMLMEISDASMLQAALARFATAKRIFAGYTVPPKPSWIYS